MFDDKLQSALDKLQDIKTTYESKCTPDFVTDNTTLYDFNELENKIKAQFNAMTDTMNTISDTIFNLQKCITNHKTIASPLMDFQTNIMDKAQIVYEYDIPELDNVLTSIAEKTCNEIEDELNMVKDAIVDRINKLTSIINKISQFHDFVNSVLQTYTKVAAVVNCVANNPSLHNYLTKFHPHISEIVESDKDDIMDKIDEVENITGQMTNLANEMKNLTV